MTEPSASTASPLTIVHDRQTRMLRTAMGPVIASIHEMRAEMQAAIKTMAPDAAVRTLGRRRLRDRL